MYKYDINSINALDWLDKNPKTANLIVTARELIAVQKLIKQLVPRPIAKHTVVAQINGQQMVLIVPGPAYAARLKQVQTSLVKQLNKNGWNIDEIIVQIDAYMSVTETKPAHKKTNVLNQESLNEFAKLEQQVAPGPLADAISRLLAHHSGDY